MNDTDIRYYPETGSRVTGVRTLAAVNGERYDGIAHLRDITEVGVTVEHKSTYEKLVSVDVYPTGRPVAEFVATTGPSAQENTYPAVFYRAIEVRNELFEAVANAKSGFRASAPRP